MSAADEKITHVAPEDDVKMTIWEHIGELRKRLVRAAIAHPQPAHNAHTLSRRIALTYQYSAMVEQAMNGTSVMKENDSAKYSGWKASAAAPMSPVLTRQPSSRSVR